MRITPQITEALNSWLTSVNASLTQAPKQGRVRGSEVGGCYIGGRFHNGMDVSGGHPEYLLDRETPHGYLSCVQVSRYTHVNFWIVSPDALAKLMKVPARHFINWSFFAKAPLGQTGLLVVYPQNFGLGGERLASPW
jgi:hypothetical protein